MISKKNASGGLNTANWLATQLCTKLEVRSRKKGSDLHSMEWSDVAYMMLLVLFFSQLHLYITTFYLFIIAFKRRLILDVTRGT